MKSVILLTCILATCVILTVVSGQPAKCPFGCSRSSCSHGNHKLFYYTPQKSNNMQKQIQPVSRKTSIQYEHVPIYQTVQPVQKPIIQFTATQLAPAPAPAPVPARYHQGDVPHNYAIVPNEYVNEKPSTITSTERRTISFNLPIDVIRTEAVPVAKTTMVPQSRSQEVNLVSPCKQDELTGRTLEFHREPVPESNVNPIKFETYDTVIEEMNENPVHSEVPVTEQEKTPIIVTQQHPVYVIQQEPHAHYVAPALAPVPAPAPVPQIQEPPRSFQIVSQPASAPRIQEPPRSFQIVSQPAPAPQIQEPPRSLQIVSQPAPAPQNQEPPRSFQIVSQPAPLKHMLFHYSPKTCTCSKRR